MSKLIDLTGQDFGYCHQLGDRHGQRCIHRLRQPGAAQPHHLFRSAHCCGTAAADKKSQHHVQDRPRRYP